MIIPKFSIIIPLYNKQSRISQTLDSVFAQTLQDFEIIIVDGGSTDESLEIVAKYIDPRITCFRQDGKGVSTARNQGIFRAKADLIALLDADDEWPENYLETIIKLYEQYPLAGIYATGYKSGNDKKKMHTRRYAGLSKDYRGQLPSYFNLCAQSGSLLATSSVVIPKRILYEINMFNVSVSYYEDMEVYTKIALKYPIIMDTNVLITYYKGDNDSLSNNIPPMKEDPSVNYINSLPPDQIRLFNDYDNLMKYLEWMNLRTATNNIFNGRYDLAKRNLQNVHSSMFKYQKLIRNILFLIPKNILKNKNIKILIYKIANVRNEFVCQ